MAEHTPEPWVHLEFYHGRRFRDVSDLGGRMMFAVMTPLTESSEQAVADGRRIRAAIQACKGVPIEVLEEDDFQRRFQEYARAYLAVRAFQEAELEAKQASQVDEREGLIALRLRGPE